MLLEARIRDNNDAMSTRLLLISFQDNINQAKTELDELSSLVNQMKAAAIRI